jgi:hypothetical protein
MRESGAVIHANPTDPFSRLPIEIMEEIAACTDMVDYLNLRLSSRVMSSLFHTQIFWRHRLNIHMELGQNWDLGFSNSTWFFHCRHGIHYRQYGY